MNFADEEFKSQLVKSLKIKCQRWNINITKVSKTTASSISLLKKLFGESISNHTKLASVLKYKFSALGCLFDKKQSDQPPLGNDISYSEKTPILDLSSLPLNAKKYRLILLQKKHRRSDLPACAMKDGCKEVNTHPHSF